MSKKLEVGQVWYSRIDGRQRAVAAVYGNGWIKYRRGEQEFDCGPKDWAAWVTVCEAALVREADGGPPWIECQDGDGLPVAGAQTAVEEFYRTVTLNGEDKVMTTAYRVRPAGWKDEPGAPVSDEHLAALGIKPASQEPVVQPEPQRQTSEPDPQPTEPTERIYVAGPMSGLPDFNYPEFRRVAERLRAAGAHVENPADNPDPACGTWRGYMRAALAQLVTCDRIHLLPGWEKSRGAQFEKLTAETLGMTITFEPEPTLVVKQP